MEYLFIFLGIAIVILAIFKLVDTGSSNSDHNETGEYKEVEDTRSRITYSSNITYSGAAASSPNRTMPSSTAPPEKELFGIYKYNGNNCWKCRFCEVENSSSATKCSVCGNVKQGGSNYVL